MKHASKWVIPAIIILVVIIISGSVLTLNNRNNTPTPPASDAPSTTVSPSASSVSEAEQQQIEAWIKEKDLNFYGDTKDTVYGGGTPLFNEETGSYIDRFDYISEKHPDKPWSEE